MATGVLSTGETLVTIVTWRSWIDDDSVSGFYTGYTFTDGFDDACAFVADNEWVLDNLRADPSGFVVMHVTAADTYFENFNENICIFNDSGHGNIGQFYLINSSKYLRFHKLFP